MNPIYKYFPFIALVARYNEDWPDGDTDKMDMVDHWLRQWLHQPIIFRHVDPTFEDVTYIAETVSESLVICLGTEGKKGWKSDFSPFPIRKYSGHNGFIKGGIDTYEFIADKINLKLPSTFIGHSRGGPRAIVSAEKMVIEKNFIPNVIVYNAPPVYTPKHARWFNRLGIKVTRVNKAGDWVDNILENVLFRHVGKCINLPKTKGVLDSIPVAGNHAYTAVFNGLIEMAKSEGDTNAVEYLMEKKGICTI